METTILLQFCTHSILLLIICRFSIANDTLLWNQTISHSEKLISSDGTFEFCFYSIGNPDDFYLVIRYANIFENNIVWVANRDHPFKKSAILSIGHSGNIWIKEAESYFFKVTNVSELSNKTYATILDSGNFILRDKMTGQILWQSFDYPTDTLLPGMKLGFEHNQNLPDNFRQLISWKSKENPSHGNFSLQADSSGLFLIIKRGNKISWNNSLEGLTRDRQSFARNQKQQRLNFSTNTNLNHSQILRLNFTTNRNLNRSQILQLNFTTNKEYLTYSANISTTSRIVLSSSGHLRQEIWSKDENQWILLRPTCGFPPCGAFSICNETAAGVCNCLTGFADSSQGCVRNTKLSCGDTNNPEKDRFYHKENVTIPNNPIQLHVNSTTECESACSSDCSCVAYALDADRGCLIWYEELHDIKITSDDKEIRTNFYYKLAASEFKTNDTSATKSESKKQLWTILALSLLLVTLVLSLLIHQANRKLKRRGENLLLFDLRLSLDDDIVEHSRENKSRKLNKREDKLPMFSFKSVAAATDNFSSANKLGEGGFGPVYKGKLLKGEEIAVKRLSRRSEQGWEELKNEAVVIAKLQHRNLVRLLGCCLEQEEKILIYEYMPNKSLDLFLFDPDKRGMLDWMTRVKIIDGVAHGIQYLHQYSRLRIIHRDLKASNILLDKDMNPKISDFGMARIFGGNESQANTKRIVGTYGYMSPEYAVEGLFSEKSDVFSFGVLLLEIITGKRNTGLYRTHSRNIFKYTWEFWMSKNETELMDPVLVTDPSTSSNRFIRYVQIALLCVQENAEDRPAMSDIISMLSNESTSLPIPKPPAFLNVGNSRSSKSSTSTEGTVNDVTVTIMAAR